MKQSKEIKKARKEISKLRKENKNYKAIKKEKFSKVFKIMFVGILVTFSVISLGVLIESLVKNKSKYMITQGKIESTTVMDTYVIREETIIPTSLDKTISALISEGSRVAKDQTIAYYKDEEHKNNEEKLENLDKEIYNSISKLPQVYSGDIKNIDLKIENILNYTKNINSYLKLEEKRKEVEDLLLEKVNIQASLSPEGANIVNLLKERENLINDMNNLGSNIKASKSGIVSYKLDGLEEVLNPSNIKDYNYIKEHVKKNSEVENFGIKIIDNFTAHLYFTADKKEIPSNIDIGRRYVIRLLDQNNDEVIGKVVKIDANENTSEIVLEINNGIEKLLDRRKFNCEFVWWEYSGMKVPITALVKKNNINYIKVIEYGEYIEIPVKIVKQNSKNAIIENYTKNELEELKIEYNGNVKTYDEVIINKNK